MLLIYVIHLSYGLIVCDELFTIGVGKRIRNNGSQDFLEFGHFSYTIFFWGVLRMFNIFIISFQTYFCEILYIQVVQSTDLVDIITSVSNYK